jgi:putative membrane protein
LPNGSLHWQRASKRHRNDTMIAGSILLVAAAIPAAIFAPLGVAFIPLGMAAVMAGANLYAWEFRRHALDEAQIYSTIGLLSPTSRVATRRKLHSVEIAQHPLARWRGYATVHLGLAGGSFAIRGVPLEDARMLRVSVLETIAATDYSRLDVDPDQSPGTARDQALSEAQSGFSSNFLAT